MSASFNALTSSLPNSGGVLTWLQIVVGLQMIICMQGTVCHLMIFMYNDNKHGEPIRAEWLNRIMLRFIPIGYGLSFLLGYVVVLLSLNNTLVFVIMVLLWCTPPLSVTLGSNPMEEADTDGEQLCSAHGQVVVDQVGAVENKSVLTHLDEVFPDYFTRYDLDSSGYIDSADELRQLAMALICKVLPGHSGGVPEVDAVFAEKTTAWTEEQTKRWFIDVMKLDE